VKKNLRFMYESGRRSKILGRRSNKMRKTIMIYLVVVLFATNAYADLVVYDNQGSQYNIDTALTLMGLTYEEKTSITAADLSAGDVLIIPWNLGGDMSGLNSSIWDAITGNILLTGHDADVHAARGYDYGDIDPGDAVEQAAQTFLSQAISFAGEQGGVGLVALGDFSTGFSYLPGSWGITGVGSMYGETIEEITLAGYASGVYDGLSKADMSDWGESYHASLYSSDPKWTVFEYGCPPVTIAHIVPVPAALVLGILGLGVTGLKLRKFA
jgi:hypothetical protein